jgi:hypothetical protein
MHSVWNQCFAVHLCFHIRLYCYQVISYKTLENGAHQCQDVIYTVPNCYPRKKKSALLDVAHLASLIHALVPSPPGGFHCRGEEPQRALAADRRAVGVLHGQADLVDVPSPLGAGHGGLELAPSQHHGEPRERLARVPVAVHRHGAPAGDVHRAAAGRVDDHPAQLELRGGGAVLFRSTASTRKCGTARRGTTATTTRASPPRGRAGERPCGSRRPPRRRAAPKGRGLGHLRRRCRVTRCPRTGTGARRRRAAASGAWRSGAADARPPATATRPGRARATSPGPWPVPGARPWRSWSLPATARPGAAARSPARRRGGPLS